MIYKIVETGTDKITNHTYFLVHFWQTKAGYDKNLPPDRINDFYMQLRPTITRIVINAQNQFQKADGTFVKNPEKIDDPKEWQWETIDNDLPAIIKKNIEAYWDRAEAQKFPLAHFDPSAKYGNSDPHDVLSKVAELKNVAVEK